MSKPVVSYLVDLTAAPIDEIRRSRAVLTGPVHQILTEARQPVSMSRTGYSGIR